MDYRRARTEDFLSIAALDREAWQDNNHAEFIPDGEHAWRIWVEHALVHCATDDDGQIVGAILAFPSLGDVFCLHKVFVDRRARGQGIGTELFARLIKDFDAQGVSAFLTVDPENAAALKLYENWGFVERRYVESYYRPHEHRYVLTRPAAA